MRHRSLSGLAREMPALVPALTQLAIPRSAPLRSPLPALLSSPLLSSPLSSNPVLHYARVISKEEGTGNKLETGYILSEI